MAVGLLENQDTVRIRLDANKGIEKACDAVFLEENQDEARTVIFEAEYLIDYLGEIAALLGTGKPLFASVNEPGRQTTFKYDGSSPQSILLTRAHRNVEQILKELE